MSTARPDASAAPPLDAALAYAARGWSVIPMQPRAKRPIVAWREFQQRRAGANEIRRWFGRWPDANVGLVTGLVSGLVVVDADASHGGADSLAAAAARHGALPPTVECATGGGGRHLYFAHLGPPVANRVALRPGIDLRGDGGCVVAPPSVHPNGRRYAWVAGRGPGECALAALPEPHFERSASLRPIGHAPAHWRRLVRDDIAEGRRNDAIASFAGHLLRRGVDPEVALEMHLAWNRTHCRPPLADAEVLQVRRSITHLHDREAVRLADGG